MSRNDQYRTDNPDDMVHVYRVDSGSRFQITHWYGPMRRADVPDSHYSGKYIEEYHAFIDPNIARAHYQASKDEDFEDES